MEVREALSCAVLQRDVLQAEKAEVAEALTKVSPVCQLHNSGFFHWPQADPTQATV